MAVNKQRKKRTEILFIRIDEDFKNEIKREAEKVFMNMSEYSLQAIREKMEREGK